MSGKSLYAVLISCMTLFALAAQAGGEPAGRERAAVLAAARAGNQAAYAKALERYNERLTREFAPKRKAYGKVLGKAVGRPLAVTQKLKAAVASPPGYTAPHKIAAIDPAISLAFQDCLKTGPKDCCTPIIDKRAAMPASCVNRALASQPAEESMSLGASSDSTASAEVTPTDASVSAVSAAM